MFIISKKINITAGFSLPELMVTVAIVVGLFAVVVYQYEKFNDKLAVSTAGQEMAVAIRKAQTYALNSRETKPGSKIFTSAYGVYFNTTTEQNTYYIFADTNGNKRYDVDTGCGTATTECVEKIDLRSGVFIDLVCDAFVSGACLTVPVPRHMTVMFKRPKLDTDSYMYTVTNTLIGNFPKASIKLMSPNGLIVYVKIGETGQILTE